MGWHFIPWNLQYLVGGIISILITYTVFRKNPKSPAYQCFLAFGIITSIWMFSVYGGRNALSEAISRLIYGIIIPCFILTQPFLLLTLANIPHGNKRYLLTLVPAIIFGLSISVMGLYDVSWTEYGWAYSLWPIAANIGYPIVFGYFMAIIGTGYYLVKKAPHWLLNIKYKLIIFGCTLYFVPLTIINILMWGYPQTPPFGGILLAIEFFFIAYAIYLPTKKIEVLPTKSVEKFSKDYLRFLNKLLEVGPGKELGKNLVRFKYHLPTLGLSNVVEFEQEKISFRPEEPKLDLGEVTDKTLDFMKQRSWTLSAVKPFTDVFVDTYETMKSQSKKDADEWFERMLRKHGAFLYRNGILDAMPEGARIPGIFRELEVGKSYLVQEDKPTRCLEMLKEAVNYGFKGLCFTMRFTPQKVRNEYGLEGVDIIWLRLNPKKGVKTLAPDKLYELEEVISKFIAPGGAVVLVDAFDQIKVVNGFEKSMKFLQKIKVATAESGANILISMRPESVWEEESAAIAKITKLHRSGPTWTSFELL